MHRPCLGVVSGATLCCSVQVSHYGGISYCGAQALGVRASVVTACGFSSCGLQALESGLSSCSTWALLFCSMWKLPSPGIEPMSLALAGGFFATESPGKPSPSILVDNLVK